MLQQLHFDVVRPAKRIARTDVQNGQFVVRSVLRQERVQNRQRDQPSIRRRIENGIEQQDEQRFILFTPEDVLECEVHFRIDPDGHGATFPHS